MERKEAFTAECPNEEEDLSACSFGDSRICAREEMANNLQVT